MSVVHPFTPDWSGRFQPTPVTPGTAGYTPGAAPVYNPPGPPFPQAGERTAEYTPLPTNYRSTGLEASRVVATYQCRLLSFTALSTLGATQWVMIFDATTLPADGAFTPLTFSVATLTSVSFAWNQSGRWFEHGIVICNSTTSTSKTIGAANCGFDVQYVPIVGYK